MAIDTARTVATLRGLTAKFDASVMGSSPFYPTLSTIVQSRGSDEQYGWLGGMPSMREWLGDRVFNQLLASHYTIANKLWESSVAIDKTVIEDDRLDMFGPVLEQLGVEAAFHPDTLLFAAIVAGESVAGWDGQFFFDTDHAMGASGAQSNDLTYAAATGTVPTTAEFKAAFRAAVTKMLGYKNDQGNLFHRPTVGRLADLVLLVPLGLRDIAYDALEAQLVGGGDTNVVIDRPTIITSANLTDDTKFYVFRVDQPIKPFIFQARRPLGRQMKGMDDREFKDVKFMTDARYNLGYGAWWDAVLTTFT